MLGWEGAVRGRRWRGEGYVIGDMRQEWKVGKGGGKANTYDHALSHRWHFVAHPVFVGEGVGAWADDLDGVCDFCRLASIGHGVLVMAFV